MPKTTSIHLPFAALLLAALPFLTACGEGYAPAEAASSSTPAAEAPGPTPGALSCRLDLGPDLGVDPGDYACVFVMGYRDAREGPPALVKKLPPGPFPLDFELTARDLMGAGGMGGDWVVVARLDSDGDALAMAGDVTASSDGPVSRDGGVVSLTLATEVTESATPTPLDVSGGHGAIAARPASAGAHGAGLPSGHPPLDDVHAPGDPHTEEAMAAVERAGAESATGEGPRITGTLELDAPFADRNGTGTLFLMVKQNTEARGMPRAVVRVANPRFPMAFDIGTEHVPLPVENKADLLLGDLFLHARLDFDGDAMSRTPGDVILDPAPVTADAAPITLVLDTEIQP